MALSTPESEPRLFYGPGPGLRLLLIAGVSVALMVLDHRDQHLKDIRRYLAAAVHPIHQLADAPFSAGRWARENLAARSDLLARNQHLARDVLVQNARLQRMATLEAENTRLRALLDSTAKVGDQVIVAEILSVDMDPLRHRIVIDKGSRSACDAHLAHYTTLTNQTQESTVSTNTVDIGFHYVPVQNAEEIAKSGITASASSSESDVRHRGHQ